VLSVFQEKTREGRGVCFPPRRLLGFTGTESSPSDLLTGSHRRGSEGFVYSPLFDAEDIMRRISHMMAELVRDESGGEVIEYALILGIVSIAAIVTIGAVGTKVLARWGSVNSSM
jgi:pilus assembly protein Flp/PilA